MNYKISTANKNQHYLDIEFSANVSEEETLLQLPAWRPGRYELANFAKNIQKFEVTDEKGKALSFHKKTKDSWVVNTKGAKKVVVNYNYYSIDFNSGSTYLDEEVLYVNPVNCFVYIKDRTKEECTVDIPKKENEKIACGLKYESGKIVASDFHEMADTPFLVSTQLQSKSYESYGNKFHVWFYGECKPEWNKILIDFKKFTDFQINQFGNFPVKEYHFINIIHPFTAYHGVEHTSSTIITLGPSYEVMEGKYVDLLGVSSHELYHTWNIKTIRPVEMNPYDYTQENYSKLGYVAEGVTTYMGDLVLYECGVFDKAQYIKEINQYLKKHFNNGGRLNMSVSDSSFDTWLDGYVMGVPDRKTSIYTEGALISLMLDMKIREATKGKESLHTVMKSLYANFGEKGIGYTEQDYKNLLEGAVGESLTSFYDSYIWGAENFEKELSKQLKFAGFELKKSSSKSASERRGVIVSNLNKKTKIIHVEKESSAYLAGLTREDVLLSINGYQIENNLDRWLGYFDKEEVEVKYSRNGKEKTTVLTQANENQFWLYEVV